MLDVDAWVSWAIAHPFLTLAMGVAVVWVCALAGHRHRRRRAERSATVAAAGPALGFVPHPDDPWTVPQIAEGLDALPLFPAPGDASSGGTRTIRDVVRRPVVGGDDVLFILSKMEPALLPDENGPSVVEYRVAAFRRSGRTLPFFHIEPREGRSRPASILDCATDIDVSDVPRFSRRYVASGSRIAAVRAILAGGLAARLADTSGWIVAGSDEWLMVARRVPVPEDDAFRFFAEAEPIAGTC